MIGEVLGLGAVCWIVTCIIVDSEIARPVRDFVRMQADTWSTIWADGESYEPAEHVRWDRTREVCWRKCRYLVACHLCSGVWVGLALAAVAPLRFARGGVVGWLLAGLLIKAVAHIIYIGQKAGEAVTR